MKSAGLVTKAPQRAALIVGRASRVAYRYTSITVRDVKKADLRFHANPAELAQAITASAQATISEFAGTAVTEVGKATTTAAGDHRHHPNHRNRNPNYVYKDEMTFRQAGRDVLKGVLTKGMGAAIGGAGMTVVVALGAGPALATAAPVLVTVGGVVYVVTAYSRIKTAMDSATEQPDDHPLDVAPPALRTA